VPECAPSGAGQQRSLGDVDRAAEAWRNRYEVLVKGDVEPRGNGVRMREVTAFVMAPE
jgi:hypothetical protein